MNLTLPQLHIVQLHVADINLIVTLLTGQPAEHELVVSGHTTYLCVVFGTL